MSHLARPLPARTRRQIVEQVAPRYREASFAQKILLLDAVVEASGYARKYAITLLNQPAERPPTIQQHPPLASARSPSALLRMECGQLDLCQTSDSLFAHAH